MKRQYNEEAAALTWEVINNKQDIGYWELQYKDQLFKGIGFEKFLSAATSLSQDINVIYVQRIKWFVIISQNFIDYTDREFFGDDGGDFFFISPVDNIELRNWEKFFPKIEDKQEFLEALELCRTCFNTGYKNRLSLETHYKYTLACDMWKDICWKYYLKCAATQRLTEDLLPKTIDEFNLMEMLDKGSFYYANSNYFGDVVRDVHSYDISSSHIGFLARKKFPYGGFTYIEDDFPAIQKIILSNYYAWYGVFYFHHLNFKKNFPINLSRFGYPLKDYQNSWALVLTDLDMKWFSDLFDWEDCRCSEFYYAQYKELPKDEGVMADHLYSIKDNQEKGSFGKWISKFRAELAFGQCIKSVEHEFAYVFNKERKEFEIVESNEELSLDEIRHKLRERKLPYYVGAWIAAYSRLEEYSMISEIGLENVVYGDTDSVKFIGDKGIKVIEKHNEEILKEYKKISERRLINANFKLGQWQNEGDLVLFKAIGIKWYLTENLEGKLEVKAAGANIKALESYLNNCKGKSPFGEFEVDMKIPNLFLVVGRSENTKHAAYMAYHDKFMADDKKKIVGSYTSIHYYDYRSPEEDYNEVV